MAHMFFLDDVQWNNFFLYREGNILHLDQMFAEKLSARIIERGNINQPNIRLFQIWNKCINK